MDKQNIEIFGFILVEDIFCKFDEKNYFKLLPSTVEGVPRCKTMASNYSMLEPLQLIRE